MDTWKEKFLCTWLTGSTLHNSWTSHSNNCLYVVFMTKINELNTEVKSNL